jgi:CHAT domain-containing protein
MVVDAERRPDLLAEIEAGNLFDLRCIACAETITVNAPLLLVRSRAPRILFSPSPGTQRLDDHNQLVHGIALLGEGVGRAWRDDLLEELAVVPRFLLPAAVAAGTGTAPATADLLEAFAQAQTRWKQQYMLAAYPGVYGAQADALLESQIAAAREKGDAEEIAALRSRRGLLANCRSAGAGTIKNLLPSSRVYAPTNRLNRVLLEASQALRAGAHGAALAVLRMAAGLLNQRDNPLLWAEIQALLAQSTAQACPEDSRALLKALEPIAAASFSCGPWLALWAGCRVELAAAAAAAAASKSPADDAAAIGHYEAAIAALAALEDPYALVRAYDALGFLHYQRLEGDRATHLEAALRCYEAAARYLERGDDPTSWSAMQFNIGDAYLQLERGDQPANLDQAVAHLERAAVVQSKLEDKARFQETVARLREAYEAQRLVKQSADPRFPDLAQALAAMEDHDWEGALKAYSAAITKTEQMLASTYRLETRREVLSDFGTAYSAAAYCCLRLGRFGEAVTLIEAGRARMASEEIEAFDIFEDCLPAPLLEELDEVRRHMRQVRTTKFMANKSDTSPRVEDVAETMNRNAWSAWLAVLEKIKAEAPQALRAPMSGDELLAIVPEGGALILPVFSIAGCCVLVAPHGRDAIEPDDLLWIDDFTDNDLMSLLLSWSAAQNSDDRAERRRAVSALCERLWIVLAGHLVRRLERLGLAAGAPVMLLPQGGLGMLALHAAAPKANTAGGFLDRYALSYAPSAYLVSVMQRRLSERPAQADCFLGVVDPLGDLAYGRAEGGLVASLFEADLSLLLTGADASGSRLRDAVKDRTHVHFSCHAYYTTDGGNYAGIMLATDPITTSNEAVMASFEGRSALTDYFIAGERWIVSQLDLTHCRLVTLSACDSGRVDVQYPDEFFGLPAALLRAGAAAVISTLWRIDDAAAMVLSRRIYDGLITDRLAPARALRAAQTWLRDATNQTLYQFYSDLRDQAVAAMSTVQLERELRRHAFGAPNDRPYADPYFWAGFVVFGSS